MSKVTNLMFKDGDDESEDFEAANVMIQTVTNGWILTITDSEDEEYTEVYGFEDSIGLIKAVKAAIGTPGTKD